MAPEAWLDTSGVATASASSPMGSDGDEAAWSLAQLLRATARGDTTAFSGVYDTTSSRVLSLVLRVVRNRAIAEEVTQEVYLQVWQTASRYDESRGTAQSWLTNIAHRRAVDRIRSTEAATRRDAAYHQDASDVGHDVTADEAHASLEATRVQALLALLPPAQRRALELAYFEGHTHVEIARLTGVPLGTAKARIRDSLLRLRGLVSEVA